MSKVDAIDLKSLNNICKNIIYFTSEFNQKENFEPDSVCYVTQISDLGIDKEFFSKLLNYISNKSGVVEINNIEFDNTDSVVTLAEKVLSFL